ncbi:hypothetical protein RJZ56_002493 [Blastomyces dermatitidis]|uniref:Ran-interacting protein Mog1 n=2 Tax=Blastomyces TaxID=229219 RepID=A0A179UAT8_BLAGS|nr:uncharacterized protein BDBG_00333 [Blastomyces gilchristii SLH14081]XP_045272911.1 uncharacterized protein BDCG_08351 [Blastomyces dermatitidis ER-3]EEQ85082.2 hypothetical protein BDCG_08351 [Blastomyces dermatitidis ER-3]EQL29392.1 hypothetical protein BDFG_07935 [Blastomyces dermatitidis ATCC 26199]OAT03632.1 hypothetical protein BDBG_00333 [Blastomyces gilchristii SLH14081]
MATFSHKDLFGGAIVADLPTEFLNVSDMRPVPDNQEAFMSNTTRTSIIIEITERLNLAQLQQIHPQQPEATSNIDATATTTTSNISPSNTTRDDDSIAQDLNATAFHLHEVCDISGDSYEILDNPRSIQLAKLPGVPAYMAQALLTSSARPGAPPAVAMAATSTCHFLLIRLQEKSTDIIAYIVVPHAGLENAADAGAVAREEMFAHEAMAKVVESFEIKDYGLFC